MNKLQSLNPRVVTAARRGPGDPVATVTSHAGRVVARLLDGRDHLVDRLLAAMHRLARRGRLVPSPFPPRNPPPRPLSRRSSSSPEELQERQSAGVAGRRVLATAA